MDQSSGTKPDMTFGELINFMKSQLRCRGTGYEVRLEFVSKYHDHDFVLKCIEDLEKKTLAAIALGEKLSPADQLCFLLLKDSAYLQ